MKSEQKAKLTRLAHLLSAWTQYGRRVAFSSWQRSCEKVDLIKLPSSINKKVSRERDCLTRSVSRLVLKSVPQSKLEIISRLWTGSPQKLMKSNRGDYDKRAKKQKSNESISQFTREALMNENKR